MLQGSPPGSCCKRTRCTTPAAQWTKPEKKKNKKHTRESTTDTKSSPPARISRKKASTALSAGPSEVSLALGCDIWLRAAFAPPAVQQGEAGTQSWAGTTRHAQVLQSLLVFTGPQNLEEPSTSALPQGLQVGSAGASWRLKHRSCAERSPGASAGQLLQFESSQTQPQRNLLLGADLVPHDLV